MQTHLKLELEFGFVSGTINLAEEVVLVPEVGAGDGGLAGLEGLQEGVIHKQVLLLYAPPTTHAQHAPYPPHTSPAIGRTFIITGIWCTNIKQV